MAQGCGWGLLFVVLAGCLACGVAGAAENYVFVRVWGSSGTANGQFNNPTGVAVDNAGDVYVTDFYNDRVQKFTSDGVFLLSWGSLGTGNGQFNKPTDVAVDDAGDVIVADSYNDRVQRFTRTGAFINSFGASGTGTGQFQRPESVAVDTTGAIYVTDKFNNKVHIFRADGTLLGEWGGIGTAPMQFDYPSHVTVGPYPSVYVADFNNNRIQWYLIDSFSLTAASAAGTFIPFETCKDTCSYVASWGSPGTGTSQFAHPDGLATDADGNVYVADWENHRIQKFSDTGNFLTTWGGPGSGPSQFNEPEGIAVDRKGNVYVADKLNDRIQKFAPQGAVVTDTPFIYCTPPPCQTGSFPACPPGRDCPGGCGMTCSPPIPPSNTGSLTITTNPEYALVTVDGSPAGIAPVRIPKISPGIHKISVHEEGYVTTEQTVSIGTGETKEVHVKMDTCLLPPPLCPGFGSLAAGIAVCAAVIVFKKRFRR